MTISSDLRRRKKYKLLIEQVGDTTSSYEKITETIQVLSFSNAKQIRNALPNNRR